MTMLRNAPAIVHWGSTKVGEYAITDYDNALRKAFYDKRAAYVALDSNPRGQDFVAAAIAWAMGIDLLRCDITVDEGQCEISSFRLTEAGKARYLGSWPPADALIEIVPQPKLNV